MKHYFSFSISFKSFYIEKINKRNRSECKKIKMNVTLGGKKTMRIHFVITF